MDLNKFKIMILKNFSRFIIIIILSFIGLEAGLSNENKCVNNQYSNNNDSKKSSCDYQSLDEKFSNSISDYRSYSESLKPQNQFIELFGIGGFQDQRLKQITFDLWTTFQEESKKQIGAKRLGRSDINNTFNGTLGSLEE